MSNPNLCRRHSLPAVLLPLIASLFVLVQPALAQTAPATLEEKSDKTVKLEKFVVTGSMIKRIADEGALPLTVFTKLEMEQEGIASAEQLIMNLNINGNGLDNLASQTDVVSGAARAATTAPLPPTSAARAPTPPSFCSTAVGSLPTALMVARWI